MVLFLNAPKGEEALGKALLVATRREALDAASFLAAMIGQSAIETCVVSVGWIRRPQIILEYASRVSVLGLGMVDWGV